MTATALPAAELLPPASVRRELLPNGLTVLVREDHSAPVVAVNTYVKAGYFDETDDVVGIAHVLEHMYFKGTPTRGVGEIARQTKGSGGYLNAHTIYDHTSYYAVLPRDGFERGLDIQADAYKHSLIEGAELAKELEVIIQEVKRKLDNPGALTTETLYELLHDRHRIRRWRMGMPDALRTFRRDDVLRFYRNHYRPRSTLLVIVGDVDADETLDRVRALYGALPDAPVERSPGPQETAPAGVRWRELSGDVQQSHLAFGWRAPGAHDPETPLLDLAAAVLGTGRGSRLYRAVRERALASSVSAYNATPTEIGVFVVHLELPPERAAEALRAAWGELSALRDAGVSGAELERVRRIIEARWLRRLETMEGQASYLAEWEALGGWEQGAAYLDRLLAATPAEVSDAARRHLAADQVAVVHYRPESAPSLAADADGLRALLAGADARMPADADAAPREAPAVWTGRVRAERVEAGVHVFRTEAGVPVLVRPKPGAAIVHLGTYVLGGAVEEAPAESGLTTLMAHASVKGTERRTAAQIASDAELLGGSVSASVGAESFGWGISVPRRHLAAAAELLADVVLRPVFPDEAFETERAIARAEVAHLRDDMYRYPLRLALEAAFAAHPYGRSATGTDAALAALPVARARAWHAERALRGASVIGVVGDIDPDETAAVLASAFAALAPGDAPATPAPAWPAAAADLVVERAKAQTALAVAFPGPARREAGREAAQLLAGIASGLGGRFFDELRDRRSLAYTVHAFASARRFAGLLGAYIATGPAQEDEAREGLLAEFAKLREAPVTLAELEQSRTYALGTHAISQQSGGAVLGDMVDAWLFGDGLAELETYDARVRAVTAADIQALAERYFDPGRRVEGVVRGTLRAGG